MTSADWFAVGTGIVVTIFGFPLCWVLLMESGRAAQQKNEMDGQGMFFAGALGQCFIIFLWWVIYNVI